MKRNLQKNDDDIGKFISAEDVASFDRSKVALQATKLMEIAQTCSVAMSQQQYTLVPDFLLVNVAIANATRAGVSSEMTVEQLKHALKMDDKYILSVSEHKTAAVCGPAKIIVSNTPYSWLLVFVDDVRQRIFSACGGQAADFIFLSWSGEQLSSGPVTRCIQNIWSRTGLGKISCTLIRKAAVSAIHQQCPDQKANLADLIVTMSALLANTHYREVDRNRTSTEAAKHLSSVLRPAKVVDDVHSQEDAACDEPANEPVACTQDRFLWDNELTNVLKSLFHDEISSKSVSLDLVRSKIKGNKILANIGCRRVYDKLRREMCKADSSGDVGKGDVPASLPVEKDTLQAKVARLSEGVGDDGDSDDSDDWVPPTSRSSDQQKLFTASEVEIIQLQCRHIIAAGAVSCHGITQALERSTSGAALLSKYSVQQIISRVKYERRKAVLRAGFRH